MKDGTKSQRQSLFVKLGVLAGFIVECLAKIFNESQIDYWLAHRNELKKKLNTVFSIVDEHVAVREEWQKFYKEKFNWDVDFSNVIVPQMPVDGKWRLLFIAKGMTCNLVYSTWTFKKWKAYDDIDASVVTNIRKSTEHYAIWVQDSIEPDTEFLGQSTKQADSDMIIGVTLLERMIHETKYFSETGEHLDVNGLTFCSGSRYSFDSVPDVFLLDDGDVCVGWGSVGRSNSNYGIRRAVAL